MTVIEVMDRMTHSPGHLTVFHRLFKSQPTHPCYSLFPQLHSHWAPNALVNQSVVWSPEAMVGLAPFTLLAKKSYPATTPFFTGSCWLAGLFVSEPSS